MRVIFTIFAGRRYFLEILFQYLDVLISNGQIHEVHLWNYTRLDSDDTWLRSLKKDRYIIYEPKNKDGGKSLFQDYYKYYANVGKYNDDDILIKCDDDIVFIDIDKFGHFINQVDENSFYFPNIVNNDVCAHIQTENKVHELLTNVKKPKDGEIEPLSKWYECPDKAESIHEDFLANQEKYVISSYNISWKSRISINFFAGKFSYTKRAYDSFINRPRHLKHFGDEPYFALMCKNTVSHMIVPQFVVTHFSFGGQESEKLSNHYLVDYYMLANKKLNKSVGKQVKATVYGVWCEKRKELWIKTCLAGSGIYNRNVTVMHKYDDKMVEIPGLDFPNEDLYSIKCMNLSEARFKYVSFVDSQLETHD